ncbi:MAG: hypothetical protein K2W82_08330 [Candidatus Obscuribacterales bacterium]|nr:hypothetical protein [Candidatus Obscuribacterales bacterium]
MKSIEYKTISLVAAFLLLFSGAGQMVLAEDGGAGNSSEHCHEHEGCANAPAQNSLNLDLSSTAASVVFNGGCQAASVNIDVGGVAQAVNSGQMLTPAQAVAAYQMLHGGVQNILLGADGSAIGGSMVIGDRLAGMLNSLVIPTNVSVINKAADLSLLGNLTNSGSIYAVTSNPAVEAANISALNILNNQGGLISSVMPTGLGIDLSQYSSILNLSLSAINNIINSGAIISSGNLTMSAGGSIQNVLGGAGAALPVMQAMNNLNMQAPDIINQGNIIAQMANINMATSALNNQGTIQAMLGNINMTASTLVENITINALSGVMQALNGSIDLRDSLYTGPGNVGIFGGDYLSKAFNIYSGGGVVDIDAGKVSGRLSISADAAHVKADTPTLVLGTNCLLGDPTYYNTGNIEIDGAIITGEDLAIVAGGNITATSTTASINTGGNDLLMIAGATINTIGCVGCSASGSLSGNPPSGGVGPAQTIIVDLNTPLGGNIDLSMSEVGTGGNYIIDTSNGGGAGGSVTLVALANGSGTGYINIYNQNAASSINAAGAGATGGAVTVYAGDADASSVAITTGDITTGGGDVTIMAAQATGNVTLDSTGQITSGSIAQGSFGTGSIFANNINTDGGQAIFPGANGINGGSVNLATTGQIEVAAITANGGAGGAGADGVVIGASGQAGGNGGNAGSVSLQADGAIFANSPISAVGGQGGIGGSGATGDSLNNGGDGGGGGNSGTGGSLSIRGSILYLGDLSNSGGSGGNGGVGGGDGGGPLAGSGGAGGIGSNSGNIVITSSSNFISSSGGITSVGGNGGDGGSGGTGGYGGAGNDAGSIQVVSATTVRFDQGIYAAGGNGGFGGNAVASTGAAGGGGNGGRAANVLISSADLVGAASGLGPVILVGGTGGDGGFGGDNGGSGGDGGQGGVFNVLSGAEILAGSITATGGAGGSGQAGDTVGGSGGQGGDGGSILLSAVDLIAGASGNALGTLNVSGGAAGASAGINTPSVSAQGGDGGRGGNGGSIVLTTLGGIDAGDINANGANGSDGSAATGGECGDGGLGGSGGSIVINALDDVVTTEINAYGGAAGSGAFAGGGSTVPGRAGVGGNGGAIQANVFGDLEFSYMNAAGGNGGNGARVTGNISQAATDGGYGGAGGAASLLTTGGIFGFEINVNGGIGGIGGENVAGNNGGNGANGGNGGSISLLSGDDIEILNLYSSGGEGGLGGDVSGGFGDAGNGGSGGMGGLQIVTAGRDINTITVTSLGGVGGTGGIASGGNDGVAGGSFFGGVVLQQAAREINIGDSGTAGGVQAGSITFITNYSSSTPYLTRVLPTLSVYFVQAGDLDGTGVNIDGGITWALSDVSVVQNTTSSDLIVNNLTLNGTQSYVATLNGGASMGEGGVFVSSVDGLISGDGTNPPTGQDVIVLANANITNDGSGSSGTISGVNSNPNTPGGQIVMVAGTTASIALGSYGTGTGIAPFLKTGTASTDGGAVSMVTGGGVNLETNSNLVFVQAIPADGSLSGTLATVNLASISTSAQVATGDGTNGLSGGSIVVAAGGGIDAAGAFQAVGATGANGDSRFIHGGAGGAGGVVAVVGGESVVLTSIAADAGAGGTGFGSGNGNMGGIGGTANLIAISSDGSDVQINGDVTATGGGGGYGDRAGRAGNGGTLTMLAEEAILGNVTLTGGIGGTGDSGYFGGGGGQGGYLEILAADAVNLGAVVVDAGFGGMANAGAGGLGGVGGVVSIQSFLTVELSSVSALGGGGGDGNAFGGAGNDGGSVQLGGTVVTINANGILVDGGNVGAGALNGLSGFGGYGGVVYLDADSLRIGGSISANAGTNGTINNSGGGLIAINTYSSVDPLVLGSFLANNYVDGTLTANGNGAGYAGLVSLVLAGGLSLQNAAGIFATTGTGLGGIIQIVSGGAVDVGGGSDIYASGSDPNITIGVMNSAPISITSSGAINANGSNGLLQFIIIPSGNDTLDVLNDGTISAGSIVGFNGGTDGTIKINGSGDINAGQYVNVGDLDAFTLQIQQPYITVSPFTGSFTSGKISITQNSITGTLQVSASSEPVPTPVTTPATLVSGSSFGLAQYFAYLLFLAELNANQQTRLNEELGTRIATDYTPYTTFPYQPNIEFPLQGGIKIDQLAGNGQALFTASTFNANELTALSQNGIDFGPQSGGNFFDLTKGYVLFMPTSDIKVQTKEGVVSIPKGTIAWVMETGNDAAIYDLHDSIKSPIKVQVNNKELTLAPGTQLLLTRDGNASFDKLNPGGNIGTRNVTEKDMGQGIKAYIADFTISGGITNVPVIRGLLNSNNPEHVKAAHQMLKNAAILSDLGGYKTPYKTKQ